MARNFTPIKYCQWCGDPFEVKSPNQKYCSSKVKNCSQEAKRESWRKASSKYRKNYKKTTSISQIYKLGSGFLSSKPQDDFDEEYVAIQKEKKRLKLKTVYAGVAIWIQLNCQFVIGNFLSKGDMAFAEINPQFSLVILVLVVFLIFGVIGNNNSI